MFQIKMIIRPLLYVMQFLLLTNSVFAQDDHAVKARIILIGDAGQIDSSQKAVISHAATQVIQDRTSVFFLGDNIYPYGMGLPGSKEEKDTQEILRSQFLPFRAKKAAVYFIPGNHDWDRSGKQGLLKIKQQGAYLSAQQDSLLKLIPGNGCPGPVEINVSPDLTVIAFDSEWWLYPKPVDNQSGNCECNTKEEMLSRLKVMVDRNKDKVILLASHHPFLTYGTHGGYKKLPLIGGLYHTLRLAIPSRQDTAHPLYKDMIRRVNAILAGAPHVVHVSGHDHGLQLIKNGYIQVVSGSGAKTSSLVDGEHALFADARPGYVIADLINADQIRLTFFVSKNGQITDEFTILINAHASN